MPERPPSAFAKDRHALGWILVGALLTFVLYLPVWLAFGSFLYHGTHPDYWTLATPARIFPLSAVAASAIVMALKWMLGRE